MTQRVDDFALASKRHYEDAEFLYSINRGVNADHLYGFATECALKSMVENFLGGYRQGGFVFTPAHTKLSSHMGFNRGRHSLWDEVAAYIPGDAPSEVLAILGNDPVSDWSVSDRYSDGGHITQPAIDRHRNGCLVVLGAVQAMAMEVRSS